MRLSFSQLSHYQACPRQYEFAIIKNIPRSLSAGESFGTSVHNALQKWGSKELLLSHGSDAQLPLFTHEQEKNDEALTDDLLLKLWHQSFIVEGYDSHVRAEEARRRGEKVMRQFYAWWSMEDREVVAVEKGFKVMVGDAVMLSGRFDRIEKTPDGVSVIDYKTTAPRSQKEVDADLQLSIYALACAEVFGMPCTELTLLFLREEEWVERKTQRSEDALQEAKHVITNVGARIEAHDFAPTPHETVCRRCPYKGVCDASVA